MGNIDNWYQEIANTYSSQQRANWYSKVTEAYDRTRPRYPQAICNRVLELTQLSTKDSILEIGSASAIATVEFARRGFTLECLEPNPEACALAQHHYRAYPQVEIINTTFEAWELKPTSFDAVLAASSFHWLAPQIRHQKAAAALKDRGWLILLWNTPPQPSYELCQLLEPAYQVYAPSITNYQAIATHQEHLSQIGQAVIDSGWFENLLSEQLVSEATYSIDNYLALLTTLSPYIKLETQARNYLLASIKELLTKNCGTCIPLTYLSVMQIAQKQPNS